ncbi:unnamed protein product, partial [Linum tenue]
WNPTTVATLPNHPTPTIAPSPSPAPASIPPPTPPRRYCTSGRIWNLLLESKDSKIARISIPYIPGGAPIFEAAAKFCYDIHVDINLSNVAMLHCASHFLEMTEEFADKNLVSRAVVQVYIFILHLALVQV